MTRDEMVRPPTRDEMIGFMQAIKEGAALHLPAEQLVPIRWCAEAVATQLRADGQEIARLAQREAVLLAANGSLLGLARKAEAEAARLRLAALDAAMRFHQYARHHERKDTDEGRAKAASNQEMAERLEQALTGEPADG